MPLLALSGESLDQSLLVLVSGSLGALVAPTLSYNCETVLASQHSPGLRWRGLHRRRANRIGMDQVLGSIQAGHPAPETDALQPGGGPGHGRRRGLLVLVVDGHQLPLGVLLVGQLSLVDVAQGCVTTFADC